MNAYGSRVPHPRRWSVFCAVGGGFSVASLAALAIGAHTVPVALAFVDGFALAVNLMLATYWWSKR